MEQLSSLPIWATRFEVQAMHGTASQTAALELAL
jgi:hypothetical protein